MLAFPQKCLKISNIFVESQDCEPTLGYLDIVMFMWWDSRQFLPSRMENKDPINLAICPYLHSSILKQKVYWAVMCTNDFLQWR